MASRSEPTAANAVPSLVAELGNLFRTLTEALFDNYRPERFYMRGPGPRWHAKHGRATSTQEGGAIPALAHARARP